MAALKRKTGPGQYGSRRPQRSEYPPVRAPSRWSLGCWFLCCARRRKKIVARSFFFHPRALKFWFWGSSHTRLPSRVSLVLKKSSLASSPAELSLQPAGVGCIPPPLATSSSYSEHKLPPVYVCIRGKGGQQGNEHDKRRLHRLVSQCIGTTSEAQTLRLAPQYIRTFSEAHYHPLPLKTPV